MIARIWRGWTTPDNADEYERLLREEIFVGIRRRHIPGFRGIRLLRRDAGSEVEFVTIMRFDSLAAVREFAGADHEAAVVPGKAKALLARFDERSQHYEVRATEAAGSDDGFGHRVRAAAVTGWWTVLVGAAALLIQWVAYLVVMSWKPQIVLSLWGSSNWPEVQHLWLVATAFLKALLAITVMICLWLTLWARRLRGA